MKEQNTDLIALPPSETALQVYSTPMGLDPFLAQIKAELDAFVPDVTTKKGRSGTPRAGVEAGCRARRTRKGRGHSA